MNKIFLMISLGLLCSLPVFSQQKDTLSAADRKALDSMLEKDEFLKLMGEKQVTYFNVSLGIGNGLFSVKNKTLEAAQSNKVLIITPAIGYYNKNGLGISFTGYLFKDSGRAKFYQWALTPSYSYQTGKTVEATVSYTRYFTKDDYEGAVSPVQNDFYGSINLKKPWFKPGIAIGYANGKFTEIHKIDTVILGIRRLFKDTMTTKLQSFSLIGTISHDFEWYKLFSKKDGLSFVPMLMVNTGSDKYTVTHQNPFQIHVPNRNNRLKRSGQTDQSSFQLQSLGLNLDMNYIIGKFNLEPQLYLDYYLPSTTEKRFTSIFSVVLGFSF